MQLEVDFLHEGAHILTLVWPKEARPCVSVAVFVSFLPEIFGRVTIDDGFHQYNSFSPRIPFHWLDHLARDDERDNGRGLHVALSAWESDLLAMAQPDHFPFPFEPYDIQEKFMRSLYSVLEEKKLGIFESPTGTVRAMLLSRVCV